MMRDVGSSTIPECFKQQAVVVERMGENARASILPAVADTRNPLQSETKLELRVMKFKSGGHGYKILYTKIVTDI